MFENSDEPLEKQFTEESDNLVNDIKYLDMQIASVQKHIISLESTISMIEQQLNNPVNKNNPAFDKGKMYAILNKTLELLPLYHSNQQRFLDLKFKYRKEQDDMKYKIVRMINIELEQFNRNNQSNSEVLETLKRFNFSDPNSKDDLFKEIQMINDDPMYEI